MTSKTVSIRYNTEFIPCGCGCKNKLSKYDKRGYERRFIGGHQTIGRIPHNKGVRKPQPLAIEFIYCGCGCQKTRSKYNRRKQLAKFITGHGLRIPRFGEDNHRYKGGRIITSDGGYVKIKKPEHRSANKYGYVYEHRIVYEEYYNCCLLDWISIHHKDGNRQNNKIENLQPVTKAQHREQHKKDMSKRICLICNVNISLDSNGKNSWFKYLDGFICRRCHLRIQWKEKYKYKKH